LDRRDLLQWMVATGGLAALRRFSPRDLTEMGMAAHARLATSPRVPGTLTPDERRIVTAAAECIIPRTETPGATDARVAGLETLDAASRASFGLPYAEASTAQQVLLAQRFDDEVTVLRRTSGATANQHWFAMLKYLTVWGFCTSKVGMRDVLKSFPRPMRYDGAAPVGERP
jgi:hypothetical protein